MSDPCPRCQALAEPTITLLGGLLFYPELAASPMVRMTITIALRKPVRALADWLVADIRARPLADAADRRRRALEADPSWRSVLDRAVQVPLAAIETVAIPDLLDAIIDHAAFPGQPEQAPKKRRRRTPKWERELRIENPDQAA